ncbi:hypothetical protein SERLA73DRAFT_157266 [Serpula lacrymans var. lacrymans S7.3]|uniref:Uncharacterized protein n=1 Tax=Serpula lacrymans var. lacrymans (strain S7.3) TaxID=936435 RepID=F8QI73_SERL3|nr:hypothetical protein SERLA73DRAFT_157266 [Serpula lacrymans var. lacrymans S7.3]
MAQPSDFGFPANPPFKFILFRNWFNNWEAEDNNLQRDMEVVLDGSEPVEISHAGGKHYQRIPHHIDYRTHCNRIHRHNLAFQEQLPALIDTYMEWCLNCLDSTHQAECTMDPSMGEMGSLKVEVADTFSTYNKFLQFFPPTGLSPLHWLDGVSCLAHPSLQQPLSRHYVTFMGSGVKMLVRTALNPCTYAVKGEEELKFQMLYTMDGNNSLKRIVRRTTPEDNNQLTESEENPCVGHWKNMKDNALKKTWAIYDEIRIFFSLCRHGFFLVIADMVQSGKLEKYPLAVVEEILNTFGEDIAGVFDINLKACLAREPVLYALHVLLVPFMDMPTTIFANFHTLPCTLKALVLRILKAVREHSQSPTLWLAQSDMPVFFTKDRQLTLTLDTGMNSNFLYNNYQQALDILSKSSIGFKDTVYDLSVTDESVFKQWLKEEKEYLMSLQKEPTKETLHMEYWQKLVNVQANRVELEAITKAWEAAQVLTKEQQVVRQIAMENYEKNLKDMNRSKTGYALQKHIGKVLQAQSAAIRTALNHYNTAARALTPPCCLLEWKEVIEYTFLSDFDLPHDTRQDMSHQPLATLAGRLAMDFYFKACRACQEIKRLNTLPGVQRYDSTRGKNTNRNRDSPEDLEDKEEEDKHVEEAFEAVLGILEIVELAVSHSKLNPLLVSDAT